MILQGKVALVTGGTTGIGRATAIAFGTAGAKVVFSGRRDAEGEKTAKLIRETGAECLYVHSDASKEEDIKALVQKTVATYGRLDCAFNNAGVESSEKPLHEQSIMVAKFTHTVWIDWMLPGIAPTGKRVEVAVVTIVQFRDGKLAHEHIYWDQASVLIQLGKLDPGTLPVVGVDSARKVLDPSLPSNAPIDRASDRD